MQLSAPVVDLNDRDFCSESGRKLSYRPKSDWTCSNYEASSPAPASRSASQRELRSPEGSQSAPTYRARASPIYAVAQSDSQIALHPSIDVYSDQTKSFAAVRSSGFASTALTSTDVRFNGDIGPLASALDHSPGPLRFRPQLMTQNTRIGIDRMSSRERVKVASTNTYPMNLNQGFSTGGHRTRDLKINKLAGSLQQNLLVKHNP